jgi:hypothetical protein
MSEQPLEGIEALMRMNGYAVGLLNGLRVVSGSFEIDCQGAFHVHEFRIVHQCDFDRSTNSGTRKKKAKSGAI